MNRSEVAAMSMSGLWDLGFRAGVDATRIALDQRHEHEGELCHDCQDRAVMFRVGWNGGLLAGEFDLIEDRHHSFPMGYVAGVSTMTDVAE